MLKSLELIDIDTNAREQVDVTDKFPLSTVYRNRNTRALDARHGKLLQQETAKGRQYSPISLGSCFTEGDSILRPFADLANYTGFYFGVDKSVIHPNRHRNLTHCHEVERVVEIVQYEGKEIVLPVEFK
jgi:hypothetical protein